MHSILNFFEEAAAANSPMSWIIWVVLGVMLIGVILMTVLNGRKNKKYTQEMMAKLNIGSVVTTIGGIVGEVVQIDENNIWLETGVDGNKTTMKFVRQAIHSVAPAPGSPEAIQEEKEEKKEANEEDEIK